MTDDTVDLLQIKIEKAKRELPLETINAINTVDWRMAILGMREKKGYTFEQLGDLELETELLLCGLVSPEDYPKELEKRMGISGADANELVNEMNDLVFKKIRGELVKNTERKKIFAKKSAEVKSELDEEKTTTAILDSASIKIVEPTLPARTMDIREEKPVENREEILKKIERPEPAGNATNNAFGEGAHPILTQKLSSIVQTPTVKTEHSLDNITPTSKGVGVPTENVGTKIPKVYPKNADPYRLPPE